MAPTVCSEKKVRVAGMNKRRRRSNMGVAQGNVASAASAGATQNSAVLSYVAKGSMNSARRLQRRRGVRLPPRHEQSTKSDASTSTSTPTPAEGGQDREAKLRQVEHKEHMEFDGEYKETGTQLARTHSSSSSNSNSSSNNMNIKTVLQPTTANSNNSNSNNNNNCGGSGNSKTTTTAKFCDHARPGMQADDDDDNEEYEEEDQGDDDSGYEYALEPIKLSQQQQQHQLQQQQQYYKHNEGLLSIAIKTIKLVQRNRLLQNRLAQLQLETSEFIASVLANPENRHFREKITAKTEAANKVSNVLLRH